MLVLLAMVASVVFAASPVSADGEGPQVMVVATGLNNPRGMSFGPDGSLFVAEAGMGGTDCMEVVIGPSPEPTMTCFGLTGSVTRIKNGRQVRIFTGYPSYSGGSEGVSAIGLQDVVVTPKGLRATVGLAGNPEVSRPMIPEQYQLFGYMGQLVKGTQKMIRLTDVAGYEVANNPEPTKVDSNPYALLKDGTDTILADAGGNSLLKIDKYGGVETLAVFPPKIVNIPPGFPIPLPPQFPMEAVPNSVVKGPDGAYYVGQLGGFPFLPGESSIFRVVPGQPVEEFQTGFTSTIDIAFDKAGNLYVLEIVANGLLTGEVSGDFTGALIRVNTDGTRDVVMQEGLWAPTGMAIRGGYIYVANNGLVPGAGEILRIKP